MDHWVEVKHRYRHSMLLGDLGADRPGALVRKHAAVPQSRNAIQLAFLDDPLVRFIAIFNPVSRTEPSIVSRGLCTTFAVEPDNFDCQLQGKYYYHGIASGAISKGSISWFMSLRILVERCAWSGPNH
jgi:hypothetical protein